ncbi:endoribonuclease YbeY, partial [Meleagris gallopavo]|uniref:endoribonuclease YbeY n=1 Tax=Meleagris gallopavo TaxID=9103 RepID=UPI0009390FEF
LMSRLNGAYRRRPEPTDVLSFPYHRVAPGELPRPRSRDDYNLGDIFLGVELIQRRCLRDGEDFESVLTVSSGAAAWEALRWFFFLVFRCGRRKSGWSGVRLVERWDQENLVFSCILS